MTKTSGPDPSNTRMQALIKQLNLQPHPEGGYYRRSYQSTETIPKTGLPERFPDARYISTAIYFLLRAGEFSALHRIKSDELWHFYEGSPLGIYIIMPDGKFTLEKLGSNLNGGESFQALAPAGSWFGAMPLDPSGYSLVGCTVAPGFDFADFELGTRAELLDLFPKHREVVMQLTR